jgi:hypothetical protein
MSKARDLANAGTALTTVSATELGYLDGVTSAVQTQLDAKAIPANVVNNTLADAKGDLITATADNTPARLAVGNNGETLVADSSTSTGLRYTAGTVQANPVLNSAMQIWQRGTSLTSGGAVTYTSDRWIAYRTTIATTGITVTRQTTNDTTNLPNIQYCARVQRDSGNLSTVNCNFLQPIETVNSIPFAGKTVTLSFYARAGTNYSAASNNLLAQLKSGTGTDQNYATAWTSETNVVSSNVVLTTDWQRFTLTGNVPSTSTQLAIRLQQAPTGTAGAADYFEVTGVQIDIGSVALPFRTYAGTIQGELAACQRYYVRFGGQNGYQVVGTGYSTSGTNAEGLFSLPVSMRVIPISIDYSTIAFQDSTNAILSISSVAFDSTGLQTIRVACGISSAVANRPGVIITNNSTSAFIGFNAEL